MLIVNSKDAHPKYFVYEKIKKIVHNVPIPTYSYVQKVPLINAGVQTI